MQTRQMKTILVKLLRWLTHPIFVFVALQIVWLTMIILWVVWFMSQQETLSKLSGIIGSTSTISPTTGIFTLVIGCVLLGIFLVGTVVLFVFTQIQSSLISQQKSFVSSVTHELRSPLSSLQLSFETLQRHQLPPNIRDKIFSMVEKDLERLSQLVERILIAGRLDRGIIDYKNQQDDIPLRELIQHVAEQQRHMDDSPDLVIGASRLALTIVLGNLLENAVKYSPAGSPIRVQVTFQEYELWISVEDAGIGLTSSEQRKIFRMFHRSPRAQKAAVPGTGLGLYIVKSIVNSMGGRIWVQSEGVNKGSRFTFALSRECILAS
jgi:signal transduction histidine kinase